MPVKQRAAKDRRPFFSVEAIELFAELERTPGGHRPYTEKSRQLAGMLGLVDAWLKTCHVNDRSSRSGYPPGHLTDIAFWKVREVRKALLAICAQLPARVPEVPELLDADEKGVATTDTPGASSAA
jgi:hypothetical protein